MGNNEQWNRALADDRIGGFFRKYSAVDVRGISTREQESHVQAEWAQRDAEARARAFAADLVERYELRVLLVQEVVPLTPHQRATLEAKLAACQARIDALTTPGVGR